MDMPPPAPQPARSRWWLRGLLIASLALNLLFVGLAVGAAMRFGGHDGKRPPPSVGSALYRAMPQEDRVAMREEMRKLRDADRGTTRKADAERIAEALRQTPFNQTALGELVHQQMTRQSGWFTATQTAWLERVAAMSAEEREAYAERLLEVIEQKPKKRGWFGKDDD
ncbi:periplasmic heavy metal sensor [Seohaeicola nanhaiensis]|uniref:Periplasmic heavy metal sensor n=1 Tax=Seohaeicola nanhaiensis TaxID=1387282 RepID=A0ABV9KIV5_9RHOB